jgi:hypothetical protein
MLRTGRLEPAGDGFQGILDPASGGSRCRRGHSARPAVQPALRRLFSKSGPVNSLLTRTSPMHVLEGGMACAR